MDGKWYPIMRKALAGSILTVVVFSTLAAPLARADDGQADPTAAATAAATPSPGLTGADPSAPPPAAVALDLAPATTPSTAAPFTTADPSAAQNVDPSGGPSASPTAPTGDFCTDYPLVGKDLYDLTQYYSVTDANTESSERPDFATIQVKMAEAATKMDILLADKTIPGYLSDSLKWLKSYFQQLADALYDSNPNAEGWQFNNEQLTEINDLMSDERKATVDGRINQLTSDGYAYCGQTPPPEFTAKTAAASASQDAVPALSPDNIKIVQAGSRYTITASGFKPGESVTGTMTGVSVGLGPRLADSTGTVTFTWIAPASFRPAGQVLTLTGAKSGSVSKPLTVQGLAGTGDPAIATPVGLAGLAALMLSSSFALAAATATRRNLSVGRGATALHLR